MEKDIGEYRDSCGVCAAKELNFVINLPQMPLTGRYCASDREREIISIDQKLLRCSNCGHYQLGTGVNPDFLYDDNYNFRTSTSKKANAGTDFFLSVMDKLIGNQPINCIVDVGCNDLHLLNQLEGKANERIGIDPIWKGKEDTNTNKGIRVIGSNIENIDLKDITTSRIDLLVCRHTLEHIIEPQIVLSKINLLVTENTLLIFEVPRFETLVTKYRFDQIFHQHQQYFTLESFKYLLEYTGFDYISHRENYHDWGAMQIVFKKKRKIGNRKKAAPYNEILQTSVLDNYLHFKNHMELVSKTLENILDIPIYGYGAAQMLPILAYHLKTDFSMLTSVIDDDPQKEGLLYKNLPLRIENSQKINLRECAILISAVDNAAPILLRLLKSRPQKIIYPLPMI